MSDSGLSKEQEDKVKKLLLAPIVCDRVFKKIIYKDGIVYSGQRYKGGVDPDMSDFAVGFYECIYGNKILKEDNDLSDSNFAGDTMNSIRTVARNSESDQIVKIYRQYRCLANFWLLPKEVGRQENGFSIKNNWKGQNTQDYMDRFLCGLKERTLIEKYNKDFWGSYPGYSQKFRNGWKTFCNKHFIDGIYVDKYFNINMFSHDSQDEIDGNQVIESMLCKIEQRADKIAKSKKAEKLYKYFSGFQNLEDA